MKLASLTLVSIVYIDFHHRWPGTYTFHSPMQILFSLLSTQFFNWGIEHGICVCNLEAKTLLQGSYSVFFHRQIQSNMMWQRQCFLTTLQDGICYFSNLRSSMYLKSLQRNKVWQTSWLTIPFLLSGNFLKIYLMNTFLSLKS